MAIFTLCLSAHFLTFVRLRNLVYRVLIHLESLSGDLLTLLMYDIINLYLFHVEAESTELRITQN